MAADAAPTAIAMMAPAEMMPLDDNSCSPRHEAVRLRHSAIHSNRKIALDSLDCRIFCAKPAATWAENALG